MLRHVIDSEASDSLRVTWVALITYTYIINCACGKQIELQKQLTCSQYRNINTVIKFKIVQLGS